eukprot:5842794-Lingulodinium_polyedra.AAC.1
MRSNARSMTATPRRTQMAHFMLRPPWWATHEMCNLRSTRCCGHGTRVRVLLECDWVLFGCCLGAARVLLGCCLGAAGGCAWVLLEVVFGCCLGAARVLPRCCLRLCLGVARVLLGYCLGAAWVLPGCCL